MEEKEINEILKRGSIRKKILLYFENLALSNTTGENTYPDSRRKDIKEELITLEQSNEIREIVKTNKNQKNKDLFNSLILSTRIYTGTKPYIDLNYLEFAHTSRHLQRELDKNLKEILSSTALNRILDKTMSKLEEKDKEALQKERKEMKFNVNTPRDLSMINYLAKLTEQSKSKIKAFSSTLERFLEINLPMRAYFEELEELQRLVEEKEKLTLDILEKRNKALLQLRLDIKPISLDLTSYKDIEYKVEEEDLKQLISLG